MNFSEASKVGSVIENMKTAEIPRALNRALINDLYNGRPPHSQKEVEDNQIEINVNFKEGSVILQRARQQGESALLKPGNFFNVSLFDAPPQKKERWGRSITRRINRAMKKTPRARTYMQIVRSQIAGVMVHGVGAKLWDDSGRWLPKFIGIQDILIPTDTDLDLGNLKFFAIRRDMRPGELLKKISGKKTKNGWNKALIYRLLAGTKDQDQNQNSYNWAQNPEKMTELWKQNASYYNSDAVPTISMWDFYYYEDDEEGSDPGWRRCIVIDNNGSSQAVSDTGKNGKQEFVYKSGKVYAKDLCNFIQFQFGDGNNVAPFKYHSIRSLGYLLYDVIQLSNRMECRLNEHVFEQMLMLMRLADPTGQGSPTKVNLLNKGIVDQAVTFIPNNERNQINPALVMNAQQKLKQYMVESATSYTQNSDNGGGGEKTATQIITEQNQVNVLVSAMLNLLYTQEEDCYREVCRRFCIKASRDPDVIEFRKQVLKDGVPEEWLDDTKWDVEAVRVLGAGNKTIELAQARELMSIRNLLNPDAQRVVDRMFIAALTDDDNLAQRLVPDAPIKVTDSVHDAELAFGTLMQGVPVQPKPGLSPREQIETILRLMTARVQSIMQSGGMGTPQDVQGLQASAQYVQQLMQQLSQDKSENQRLKQYGDVLGKLMNEVKAFAQRQQEQAQKSQIDPVKAAELQIKQQMAQLDQQRAAAELQVMMKTAQIEAQQQQQAFIADQQRKNQAAQADIARKDATAQADIARGGVETSAALGTTVAKTRADIAAGKARINAEVDATDKRVTAEVEAQKKRTSAEIASMKKKDSVKPNPAPEK